MKLLILMKLTMIVTWYGAPVSLHAFEDESMHAIVWEAVFMLFSVRPVKIYSVWPVKIYFCLIIMYSTITLPLCRYDQKRVRVLA